MDIMADQNGSSGVAHKMSRSYVRASHPVPINLPSHGRRQSTIPKSTTDPARQSLAGDAYEISTTKKTLLRSTFTPTDSRRPVYDVTTDVSSPNRATTLLWRFDPGERKVTEVARITWSASEKTMVEMAGVCVAATELLIKSKWRLGMSSSVPQTFTSQMEEYRWIPQHTLFNADSCAWKCVVPILSGTTSGLTILSVYTPSSPREPLQPSNANRLVKRSRPTSSSSRRSSISSMPACGHHLRSDSLSGPGKGERPAALLEMYPEVNTKPHLREIVILTAILVVVHKDEWRSLPRLSAHTTTSDLVLSRLSETHGAKLGPSTANNITQLRVLSRPGTATGTFPPRLSVDSYCAPGFGGSSWS